MKRLLLRALAITACVAFSFAGAQAQVITAERAQEIANNFFQNGKQKSAAVRSTTATSLKKSADSRILSNGSSNEAPTFHILTGTNGEGFVIVSGEEIESPIIGYSFEGTIDTNNLPAGFVDYITDIDAQVKALRKYNAENPQKAAAARSAMQKTNYNATTMGEVVKNLNTAPWGQSTPFNNLCKTEGGQTALTGCGPTAFAILCYYYKWPASGVGTVTHQGTLENMELGHEYDYASMRNDNYQSGYNEAEANAVAVLMRDLGWANNVGYGTGITSFIETAQHMVDHFRFKSVRPVDHGASLAVVRGTLGNDTQWKTYIKNNLNAGYPIPYSSTTDSSNSARHIYILDGYTDNDYYHFNWGWNGNGNGWFTLDNMVPDNTSNYSNSHRAYYIIPDATTYTVTATVNDSNMGTVSINGGTAGSTATADLFSGATATLTAHPAQGYALASWTKNGVVVGSRNTIEVTVGTDANDYVANFDDEANVIVTTDCTVSPTTGELNNGTSRSSTWTSNEFSGFTLTATSNSSPSNSISTVNGQHKFYAFDYDQSAAVTYTLSVPDGYVITEYSMTFTKSTESITVSNSTSSATTILSAEGLSEQSTSFTVSGTTANEAIFVTNFTVTIQSEGGATPPSTTTYTITATANPGTAGTVTGGGTYNEGATVTLTATPNSGYEFVNWTKGGIEVSTNATYSFTANANAEYVAHFQTAATTFAVTTTANPAAGGTATFAEGTNPATSSATVASGTGVTLYAVANDGYRFVNWTKGGIEVSTNATHNVTITEASDYVANFEEEAQAGTFPDGAYKIFWQQNGRGYLAYHTGYPNEAKLADVTYPDCQNKHFASTSPEVDLVWYLITAQDGNRYLFHAATGKFIAANTDVSPTNTSKANKLSTTEALSIRIEENTAHSGHYVIMATVNSTDALLSSGCGTSSETGNPVRWWYDNANTNFMSDGGSPLQFVSTTADVSDAIMNQVRLVIDGVDITANAGEGGSVTINGEATGTKRVIKGSSVTLNATPASGYSFLNWSNAEGIVSETAEYTFTANSATTLRANFERITYTVNVNANPIEGGTVTGGGTYNEGETVTLTATPAGGYVFANWTNNLNTDIVTENPYTPTVAADVTYTANFEQNVVNATLTDAEGNTYEMQVSGFTAEITKDAVAEKLREAYPYITVGATDQEGNVIDLGELTIDGTAYTYTNRVELPFRVTNTTYLWHNIYYPSNSNNNPNYIAALNEDEIVDMAASAEYAYGDNPTYNTRAGNPKISWAIYNVNNNFEFIFKNAFTNKYIKVESVANATTQNVKFVENAEDATIFTLLKDADSYNGDYALVAKVGDATGYLCATSSAQNYVTHFDHTNHQGAWVKFVEAPYYDTEITDLGLVFSSFFGAGDGKYIITDEMSVIDNAIANNSDNITFNTINEYYLTIEEAINNWPAVRLTINPAEGGTTNINGEENVVHKYVPNGYALPLAAVPADGYRFVNWTLDGNVVSTDANYNVTVSQDANYVANFEIEESQDGLTTGYYHIVSRVTSSHEYLYNNALRTNNSKEFTLQSDSKITTNNGIWYITVNSTQLGVKNGDGNALVTGTAYCAAATSHNTLNIEKTTDVDGVTYYSFVEGINCTNRSQPNFTLEGGNSVQATDNNYVTTWDGHPDDQANQWRLERVDTDGKNIYDVVVECTEQDVYVVYGSGTNEEYAFNGGFFITDATITTQQLTAKKGDDAAQGVTVLVEGNTIRVVDAEYVDITVSATPAEGGSVTINDEAESTLQVVKSSNVTVVATPVSGYHFVNWTDAGGNAVSTDATYTFRANSATTLTANFEADVVYHTITVSTFYDNDGGTVKVGDENATSVNVAEGGSVRMLATVAEGYEFMGWLKDGVIVKNAIDGGLDFEVQGPDYTLYEIKASAEYVAVFSKITDYTNLEDGKAYRIRAVSESCAPRYIYREGTELKWTNDDSNFDDNSIFVVQKNGNSINLISAIGYHGWKASNELGNDEQYNPYAAIKVTYGTKDDTRSLYLESGTSSGIYTTLPDNVFAFMNTPSKSSLPIMDADNRTTNFLFEEVDTYAFQVSVADGSNAKLGTINLPFATTVHPSITAYAVTGSDENYAYVAPLTLENNILPANTPVLVEAEAAGKYGFKPAPASNKTYDTGFAGTLEAEKIGKEVNAYILSYKGAGTAIKLYKLASDDRTINANKAYYIDETGSSSAISFKFIGTTDINGITDADSNVEGIYDLQGRKLDEITEPGIYIVNGKKILVK